MTALYTNDFESATAGAAVTGWTTVAGSGMLAQTYSATSLPVVQGVNGFGRNSDGDRASWTDGGSLTDQAIRTATKVPTLVAANFRAIGHVLRANSGGTQAYFVLLDADGTGIRARIFKYNSGNTVLSASGYVVSPSSTDTLHFESKIVGTAIEVRMWLNSAARPSSPTVSATDSSFTSGYAGLRHSGAFGWALVDQLVITDGAGGEDYFYPASSGTTINCTVGDAVAAGVTASIQQSGTTTIGCSVGNAVAAGVTANTSTNIVTDVLHNNNGSIHANQAVVYDWYAGGRIGSGSTVTSSGSGTTDAQGRLVTSIPMASGILMLAKQNGSATVDDVYYQAF